MKLHILSDLHLESSRFDPIETDADVVVLAGDIWLGAQGVHWAAEAFPGKRVMFVPGNHELYGSVRVRELEELRQAAAKHDLVHFLNNDEIIIQDVRFLGATLWTDFALHGADMLKFAMNEGQLGLNDFRVIREGEGRFSPQRSIELHNESLSWLKDRLAEPHDGKTVVVTHHLPSMLSVSERYKTDLLSACFSSNLDDLFGKMNLWVHGHTHDNFDYVSQGTRVVCNPRGYVRYDRAENGDFDPRLVVEV